jgi:hypothetical protein
LAGHDKHFASINGSLADIANEMHGLTLAVQRLGDQAEAAAKTVVTTAAALKAADDARRSRSESSWSPWQKAIAVLLAAVAVVGLYFAISRG